MERQSNTAKRGDVLHRSKGYRAKCGICFSFILFLLIAVLRPVEVSAAGSIFGAAPLNRVVKSGEQVTLYVDANTDYLIDGDSVMLQLFRNNVWESIAGKEKENWDGSITLNPMSDGIYSFRFSAYNKSLETTEYTYPFTVNWTNPELSRFTVTNVIDPEVDTYATYYFDQSDTAGFEPVEMYWVELDKMPETYMEVNMAKQYENGDEPLKFKAGKYYALKFVFTPRSGYTVVGNVKDATATVNGKPATFKAVAGNSMIVYYCYDKLEKSKFTDVPATMFYAPAVNWAVDKGITSGITDTTFGPDKGCTRGQAVTFLWRAAGSPKVSGTFSFTDVKPGSFCEEAVRWAVLQGITSGTSDTTFSPDAICTRGQIVTFLHRYNGAPNLGSVSFQDVKEESFCYDAVKWAVHTGITKGTSDTTFSPDQPCTRAQIVTFLYRLLEVGVG